jgi:hypothetical protein
MFKTWINPFTLRIKQDDLQKQYIASHTNKIFITGIVLSIIRLTRLIFAALIPDAREQFLYFVPEYDVLKWVTYGIQVIIVIMQRLYPEKLNVIAIPLWILVVNATIRISSSNLYSTDAFLFK